MNNGNTHKEKLTGSAEETESNGRLLISGMCHHKAMYLEFGEAAWILVANTRESVRNGPLLKWHC